MTFAPAVDFYAAEIPAVNPLVHDEEPLPSPEALRAIPAAHLRVQEVSKYSDQGVIISRTSNGV